MTRAARATLPSALASVFIAWGCIDSTTGPFVAGLEIVAPDTALLAGHTLVLTMRAWDIERRPVTPPRVEWGSADPNLLAVDSRGTVWARAGTIGGDVAVWVSAGPGQASDTIMLHVAVPGEVKWRLSLGPMLVMGGPAEGSDGAVYALTYTNPAAQVGTLHAVSLKGEVMWQRVITGTVENAPFVGPDGTVYVVGQHQWAFTPQGGILWAVTPPLNPFLYIHFGAAGSDGVVYAAVGSDVRALRGSTGDSIWRGPNDPRGGWLLPPTVSPDGKTVFAKNTGDSIYAFAAATGVVRWQVPDPLPNRNTYGVGVALADGRAYIPAAYQLLVADTAGNVFDTTADIGCCVSEPAIGPDGTLYVQVAGNSYGLHAIDANGAERWSSPGIRPARGWYGGPALAAGGVLYAAAMDGFYSLQLSATGATVRWRFPADTSQKLKFFGAPLIGRDGTVYSFSSTVNGQEPVNATDELFAFWEDKPVEPNSPWPMWRHDARRSGQAHR